MSLSHKYNSIETNVKRDLNMCCVSYYHSLADSDSGLSGMDRNGQL